MQGKVNFTPCRCPLFWSIPQPSKPAEQLLSVQLVPAASHLLPPLCPSRCRPVQSVPSSRKLDHRPSRLVQRPCVCKVSGTSWVLCGKLMSCSQQPVSCGSLGHIWLDGCGPPNARARATTQVGRRWSSEASDGAEMALRKRALSSCCGHTARYAGFSLLHEGKSPGWADGCACALVMVNLLAQQLCLGKGAVQSE